MKSLFIQKSLKIIFASLFLSYSGFALSLPINETTLPLSFDSGNPAPDGIPSTVITIQGRQFPIVIDSGAKKTTLGLTPKAIKGLQVKFLGTEKCTNSLDSQHNCQKEFIIPEITIGGFKLHQVKASLMDPAPWDGDQDFKHTAASDNGMIGFALLKEFNFLLDYPHKKMVLAKKGHQPQDYNLQNWHKMDFTGQFLTKIQMNGQWLSFSWDTGAIPSVIKQSLGQQFPVSACPANKPYSRNHCQSIVTSRFITASQQSLPNTWFRLRSFPDYVPFDGLIGANFFEKNPVYFDFDHHQISVAPEN